jgi:hypothetical protein
MAFWIPTNETAGVVGLLPTSVDTVIIDPSGRCAGDIIPPDIAVALI